MSQLINFLTNPRDGYQYFSSEIVIISVTPVTSVFRARYEVAASP